MADRLKQTREETFDRGAEKPWTQQRLADEAGVSQGWVGNVERGIRVNTQSNQLGKVAAALGVRTEWLRDEIGEKWISNHPKSRRTVALKAGPETTVQREPNHRVPLIEWSQVRSWLSGDVVIDWDRESATAWTPTPAHVGQRSFALRARGDSMSLPGSVRSIPDGAEVVVDPDLPGRHNEIVLVRPRKGEPEVFRVYWLDGVKPWLKAWNEPLTPRIEVTSETEILGVAVEVIPIRHSLRP